MCPVAVPVPRFCAGDVFVFCPFFFGGGLKWQQTVKAEAQKHLLIIKGTHLFLLGTCVIIN